jgi:hypothetical protein
LSTTPRITERATTQNFAHRCIGDQKSTTRGLIMIRTALAIATASLALSLSAFTANAAGLGSAAGLNLSGGSTPVIAVGGHKVCLQAQCPGRSRIVCGCARSTR